MSSSSSDSAHISNSSVPVSHCVSERMARTPSSHIASSSIFMPKSHCDPESMARTPSHRDKSCSAGTPLQSIRSWNTPMQPPSPSPPSVLKRKRRSNSSEPVSQTPVSKQRQKKRRLSFDFSDLSSPVFKLPSFS
eukprot:815858_1